MNKRFRSCSLDQPFLLPPSLHDWLPQNHLARFIADVVAELDLNDIYADYERRDGRGQSAYHPLMLTRLLLYAYCIGKPSSRQIEKATHDDIAFRYLASDQHPDHDTIAHFRQQHLQRLAKLFAEALRLCREAGLVKLGHVALDGTKVAAQASFRRNFKGNKVLERERKLAERVAELLAEAGRVDAEEDARHGEGRRGDELPAELATTEKRLAKLRQIKEQMEQRAREQAADLERRKRDAGGKPRSDAEKQRWKRAKKRSQLSEQTFNTTDPDSRSMKDGSTGAIAQAYNAQAAVDDARQIIVAASVTNECNDKAQILPMVKEVNKNLATQPVTVTADAGYWCEELLADEALKDMDILVPPDAQDKHKQSEELSPNAPRTPRAEAMRARLKTPEVAAVYAQRKTTVEPVFGYIKQWRGFRRFSLRGLVKVQAEWALICLTHNLLKLYRHRMAQSAV